MNLGTQADNEKDSYGHKVLAICVLPNLLYNLLIYETAVTQQNQVQRGVRCMASCTPLSAPIKAEGFLAWFGSVPAFTAVISLLKQNDLFP